MILFNPPKVYQNRSCLEKCNIADIALCYRDTNKFSGNMVVFSHCNFGRYVTLQHFWLGQNLDMYDYLLSRLFIWMITLRLTDPLRSCVHFLVSLDDEQRLDTSLVAHVPELVVCMYRVL